MALHFRPGANQVFADLARLLARSLQLREGAGARWQLVEATPFGEAPTQYAVLGLDAESWTLEKRRTRYLRLTGRADAPLDADARYEAVVDRRGFLHRLHGAERVDGADGRLAIDLIVAETFTALPPAVASLQTEQQVAANAEAIARRQLLAQRIGDLTPDGLLNKMASFGALGEVPDHKRFLWQATALLRTDPALCAALGKMAQDPGYPAPGRGLVFDLLAGAGSSAAQAALRDALDAPAVQADARYGMHYQHLSLLQSPDAATLDFLAAKAAAPGPEGREVATVALGAGIGNAWRHGDRERAAKLGAGLAAELASCREPLRQATLLQALGNAGLPDHVAVVMRAAGDADQYVRGAAAAALRKTDDEDSRTALLGLASDPAGAVQREALRSLAGQSMSEADFGHLAALVEARAIDEGSYQRLVQLLAPHLEGSPGVEQALRAILAQDLSDASVKTRVRGLLGAG